MDLVDEQDGVGVVLQFLDHLLDPLLEVAAIAGSRQEGTHVEGEDGRAGQDLRHLLVDDLAGQALGDGGLADAGIPHKERIVLGPAAQDLDAAIDLCRASDQGVDLALPGLLVEVDAVGVQGFSARFDGGLFLVFRTLDRLGLIGTCLLGDAMRDVVHRIIPGHVLLLQEIGGVAFPLREDGDQHVGAGHVLASR